MKIKQLSLFFENGGVNIRALSIADTSDFGILRLIVPEPEKTKKLMEDNSFIVKIGEVIAVRMPDKPGGLGVILGILDENNINLEYLYAFVEEKDEMAIVLLHPENIDDGIKVLESDGAEVVSADEIYGL